MPGVPTKSRLESSIKCFNRIVSCVSSCVFRYTGIFLALKGEGKEPDAKIQYIMPNVPHMIGFIQEIIKDGKLSDTNIKQSTGLIGDIVQVFGQQLLQSTPPPLSEALCVGLLGLAEGSQDKEAHAYARFLRKNLSSIGKLLQSVIPVHLYTAEDEMPRCMPLEVLVFEATTLAKRACRNGSQHSPSYPCTPRLGHSHGCTD